MSAPGLHQRLAELVGQATEGTVVPAEALAPGASLSALGLDSLGLLRLIDAIEDEYDVELDLTADRPWPDTLDLLAGRLAELGVAVPS